MITRYGMSDEFGMVAMEQLTNQYLGGDTTLACSDETSNRIDQVVRNLISAQYDKAFGILKDNAAQLHALAKYLYEHETITGDEFMDILHKTENRPVLPAETAQSN